MKKIIMMCFILVISLVLVGCNNEDKKVNIDFRLEGASTFIEVDKGTILTDDFIPFEVFFDNYKLFYENKQVYNDEPIENDVTIYVDIERTDISLKNIYSLKEIFDENLLTTEDLKTIAYYQSGGQDYPDLKLNINNLDKLDEKIVLQIKEAYIKFKKEYSNKDLLVDNIEIYYFGTYNEFVAVKIFDSSIIYPQVIKTLIIDDIKFTYTGPVVQLWKLNYE